MNAIDEGKTLLSELGITPVYIVQTTDPFRRLSEAEHRFTLDTEMEHGIAFTSPVADIVYSRGYLKYDWRGRGCCIVFRQSPLLMTATETLGTLIHEAGHHVAAYDRPERDDLDLGRAVKTFWQSMSSNAEHHGRRWLRATIHLWHRACKLGWEIPFSNVLDLAQYGFTRTDLLTCLDEAEDHEGEPVETILARTPSGAPARAGKRRRHDWSMWIAGRHVRTADGKTTIDDKPVSEADFQKFLRAGKQTRDLLWPSVSPLYI